jgi:hypothetical protein
MLFGAPLRVSAWCFSPKTTFNCGATCRQRGDHKRRGSSGSSWLSRNGRRKKVGKTREKIEISAEQRARFRSISGSENPAFAVNLASQVGAALWRGNSRSDEQQEEAMLVAMSGMEPRDAFEGMLIAQAIASHNAAMECHRRAMIPEQTFESRRENLNQANKLSRTFAALSEVLDRHRGKGQQRITVEHVNVQAGGQAIVGAVTSGLRSNQSSEEQTHAMPEITYEPIIPMRSPDGGRIRTRGPTATERPWAAPNRPMPSQTLS